MIQSACALIKPKLLRVQDGIFAGLGDAELNHFLSWNLDRLASGRIAASASLAIHQHELAQARQGEAVLGILIRQFSDEFENLHGGALGHIGLFRDGGCDLRFR